MNNLGSICMHLTQIGVSFSTLRDQGSKRIRENAHNYSFRGFSGWVLLTKDCGELMIFDSDKNLVLDAQVGFDGTAPANALGVMTTILDELRYVRKLESGRKSA
jgi:hypothetical protein